MKTIVSNSIWATFIFYIVLIILGAGLQLFQNPIIAVLGAILFILSLITIPWYGYIYTNNKNDAIEYFSACPLCGSSNILVKLSWSLYMDDTHEVICQNCGAKWIMKTSGWTGKVKTVKLVKPSDNMAGQEHLGKETDPEFWITIARKRKREDSGG